MRARARHAKPSRLRHLTLTTGLATAVAVPLFASPASAHTVTASATTAAASSSSGTYNFGYLKQGSTGPRVVELQKRLKVSADGSFGRITKAAVVSFQRRHGLTADGVVGPRTGAALNRYTSGRSTSTTTTVARTSSTKGAAVVAEAARHKGKPYVYGADGPNSFDCSGFVQYVYGRLGVNVPRTSGAQAAAARPVSKSSKQLGDLIIFRSGGRVSHVGIYAGGNTMWVARHSGTTITRQTIYTSAYSVGRFL